MCSLFRKHALVDIRKALRDYDNLSAAHRELLPQYPAQQKSIVRCIDVNYMFILHMLQDVDGIFVQEEELGGAAKCVRDFKHSTRVRDLKHSTCVRDFNHSTCIRDFNHSTCVRNLKHSTCVRDLNHSTCVRDLKHSTCVRDFEQCRL